jgi:vacuolar-type H+-ATPase subunit I/STV1
MVRRSWLVFPISVLGLVVVMALGVGVGISYAVFEPPKSKAQAQLQQQETHLAELDATVVVKDRRIEELLARQSDLQQELAQTQASLKSGVATLEEERSASQRLRSRGEEAQRQVVQRDREIARLEERVAALSVTEKKSQTLVKALNPLEADRLLLVEMRKDAPDNRKAATEYWENVKRLAVQSDPSLGPKVDRVLRLLPAYFDYIDAAGKATSCEQIFSAYTTSGVIDYFNVESDFRRDLFLILINRIDAVVSLAGASAPSR